MSYTWTDIANGEAASSVRTKINGLGAEVEALDGSKGNGNCIVISNISVSSDAWTSGSTYSDYPYKTTLSFAASYGINANYVPFVIYNVDDAQSGVFAPVALSSSNALTIYASEAQAVTIPTIAFIAPVK